MKNLLFILIFAAVACGPKQETPVVETVAEPRVATSNIFLAGLETQLSVYFDLKDALVATDADSAKNAASALITSLNGWVVEGLSAEADSIWSANKSILLARSEAIVGLTDVEAQRMEFETLSMAMIDVVEAFGPLSNAVYRQTCPMVRGGSADWLAREEQIANPYHGSRMLRCGDVVRKI
jgi:Cu(I)/Ag(I) efflux system membrane fusion protein